MGTRASMYILDEQDRPIVKLYRQCDGYPSGHGDEVLKFLKNKKLVNGIGSRYPQELQINGMSDLAVRLITHLKNLSGGENDAGGLYLHHQLEPQIYHYVVYAKKIRDEDEPNSHFPTVDHLRIAFKCEGIFDDLVENLEVGSLEPEEDLEDSE